MELGYFEIRHIPQSLEDISNDELLKVGLYLDLHPRMDEVDDEEYSEFLERVTEEIKQLEPITIEGQITDIEGFNSLLTKPFLFISSLHYKEKKSKIRIEAMVEKRERQTIVDICDLCLKTKEKKEVLIRGESTDLVIEKAKTFLNKRYLKYSVNSDGVVLKVPITFDEDAFSEFLEKPETRKFYKRFTIVHGQDPLIVKDYLDCEVERVGDKTYDIFIDSDNGSTIDHLFTQNNQLMYIDIPQSAIRTVFLALEELKEDYKGHINPFDSKLQREYMKTCDWNEVTCIEKLLHRHLRLLKTGTIFHTITLTDQASKAVSFSKKIKSFPVKPIVAVHNGNVSISGQCLSPKTFINWVKMFKETTETEGDIDNLIINGMSIGGIKNDDEKVSHDYLLKFNKNGEYISVEVQDFPLCILPYSNDSLEFCSMIAQKWKSLDILTPFGKKLLLETGKLIGTNCFIPKFFMLNKSFWEQNKHNAKSIFAQFWS